MSPARAPVLEPVGRHVKTYQDLRAMPAARSRANLRYRGIKAINKRRVPTSAISLYFIRRRSRRRGSYGLSGMVRLPWLTPMMLSSRAGSRALMTFFSSRTVSPREFRGLWRASISASIYRSPRGERFATAGHSLLIERELVDVMTAHPDARRLSQMIISGGGGGPWPRLTTSRVGASPVSLSGAEYAAST